MADLTIQSFVYSGLDPTYAAASAGGDAAVNTNLDTVLVVKNEDVSAKTVTITAQLTQTNGSRTEPPVTIPNIVVNVGAGNIVFIGPIHGAYNDGNDKLQITYDDVTSLSIAAIKYSVIRG